MQEVEELLKKRTQIEEMKNFEKEKKKYEVIHKIENLRVNREHSKMEMVENTWKVSKKPLFKKLEEKYE